MLTTDTGMTSLQNTSRIPGFYDLGTQQRLQAVTQRTDLSADQRAALHGVPGLTPEQADHMIENVVGVYALPLGVAAKFRGELPRGVGSDGD